MDREAFLRALLEDLQLAVEEAAIPLLVRFLDELERWSRSHNLTAVRGAQQGVETHLVDSLSLLPYLPVGSSVLDFGSGGGLPGLPLKIARPDLVLCSIDAVAKKLAFQRHVVRQFGLSGVQIRHVRLEVMAADSAWQQKFSRVVFRAVGELFRFAAMAQPVLQTGGWLIAMKGPDGEEDWRRLQQEPLPGYRNLECTHFQLPRSGARRTLILLEKTD